jgi:polyisoprenoid-binding protein YceI
MRNHTRTRRGGMRRGGPVAVATLAFAIFAGSAGWGAPHRSFATSFGPASSAKFGSSRAEEASEIVLTLDPTASKVHWTLGTSLHTVHGTFALKRGSLHIDRANGKAGGEIVADATTGDSGDTARDKRMHTEVLESPRYAEVVFRPDRMDGTMPAQGNVSGQLHGMLILHGAEHELTVPVRAELAAGHWKGTGKFEVPYIAWGLKNPSKFLLKADPVVGIELDLSGTTESRNAVAQ